MLRLKVILTHSAGSRNLLTPLTHLFFQLNGIFFVVENTDSIPTSHSHCLSLFRHLPRQHFGGAQNESHVYVLRWLAVDVLAFGLLPDAWPGNGLWRWLSWRLRRRMRKLRRRLWCRSWWLSDRSFAWRCPRNGVCSWIPSSSLCSGLPTDSICSYSGTTDLLIHLSNRRLGGFDARNDLQDEVSSSSSLEAPSDSFPSSRSVLLSLPPNAIVKTEK